MLTEYASQFQEQPITDEGKTITNYPPIKTIQIDQEPDGDYDISIKPPEHKTIKGTLSLKAQPGDDAGFIDFVIWNVNHSDDGYSVLLDPYPVFKTVAELYGWYKNLAMRDGLIPAKE
jgi:hypothetical protein